MLLCTPIAWILVEATRFLISNTSSFPSAGGGVVEC